LFERALCCLRYHPEVWIAYARYELGPAVVTESTLVTNISQNSAIDSNIATAKTILREAIECNSGIVSLRLVLAELVESLADTDACRDILKQALVDIPCSLTFALYQRFVRRINGVVAARRVFSDTLPQRIDGIFNYEVILKFC
jgi:hypothetical protein